MGLEVRSRALPAGRRLFVAEFHADDEAASE
jgi:hypothetical protein